MIEITRTPRRFANGTAVHLAPALLVAAWGVAWIAFHASQHGGAHTLLQTLALAESVIALLLRRRKPVGALAGILIAYFVFELDPLLLPALLIALFTVAAVGGRRTVLLATAATATTVAALPLTGRASIDLAGYLLRLLGVAAAAAIGLRAQTHAATETHTATETP
jgi:FtsH-binding integral membrane protein